MSLLDSIPYFTYKGNDNYVMEINNTYFNINEEVKIVIEILHESKCYSEATLKYNELSEEDNTEAEFSFYSKELLKKFDLNKKRESFLLVEKIILPKNQTSKLAKKIQWAFNPIFFWPSFIILSIFSIFLFFFKTQIHQEGNNIQIPILLFVSGYFLTVLLHELGHVAACRKFTGTNGGIGIGIYLIYPVFYSDISMIWRSTRHQKVITNLAGIYMQFWCVLLGFIIGYFTKQNVFIDFSKSLTILCIIQIFPFIRSDGYWLLSDLSETPNLLSKSKEKINELFLNTRLYTATFSLKNFLVTLYGLMNIFIIILFAYYQIFVDPNALIELPHYIIEILQKLISGDVLQISFDSKYISAILFYYLLIIYTKKLINSIKKHFQNRKIKLVS